MSSSSKWLVLQGLANKAISLDALLHNDLKALGKKSLRIECTNPNIDLAVLINDGLLELIDNPTTKSDCHIKGEFSDFVQLLAAKDKGAAMINSPLTLSGDSQLLLKLQDAISNVELDIEHHLAPIIGDIPAHQLGKALRSSSQFIRSAAPSFVRHLQEFLIDEAKLSPSPHEFERWIQGINQCTQGVERLEARLTQWIKNRGDRA